MRAALDVTPPAMSCLPCISPREEGEDAGGGPDSTARDDGRGDTVFSPGVRFQELIGAYPDLEAVCARVGFGTGLTLGEWCQSPHWALLDFARAALPPVPRPTRDWTLATIPELIEHLVSQHHRVLRNEMARLRLLIDNLAAAQPVAVLKALSKVFGEFQAAMQVHLDLEESGLFPLCIRLEDAALNRCAWGDEDVTTLLRFTNHGHEECDSGLRRCRKLAEAAAAVTQDPDMSVICAGLAAIAHDLATHTALEGDLLIPAAIFAQDQVRSRRQQHHG